MKMNCHLCGAETNEGTWTNCRYLCQPCAAKPRIRYYYALRPPCIGTEPSGFIDRKGEMIFLEGWHFHGWVDYPAPLEFERAWRYDLIPSDEGELERYREWREENDR